MDRSEVFRQLLTDKGHDVHSIAEVVGVKYHTFRRQIPTMNFNIQTIVKLKNALNLTDTQVVNVLLPDESEVKNVPKKDKVILVKEVPSNVSRPILIDSDLLDQIKELKLETGIPIQKIVEKFIRFGLENTEVIESEDY
ncbi:hypothetical protein [Facklamia sp. 7083-14-GEN3]|uniref:hypothetical protein n=1 Tax=Facklamia sp. 7083-14-GEN3 TaxID=2973478 RepID=UPI00215C25BA|nr:hypothetical protein [Facklamia sp. 7083-14-GEN3]MCR8969306.1 hypothetical protein [Facklamia sp. 7083-14-GEN3]